ncbi:MAG: hypothetical protein IKU17_07505 [Clostridia bacterium]|nr:hypothetical protein [Clostridia bacterium]
MKKRTIAILLCLLMLLTMAGCQKSGTASESAGKASAINPPVPGMTWGMTADEVTALLKNAGVEDVKTEQAAKLQMIFTHEQAVTLGADQFAGVPLYDLTSPIVLFFECDKDGTNYLVKAAVNMAVENKEAAVDALTKEYGKPLDDGVTWILSGKRDNIDIEPSISANESWRGGKQTIYLHAAGYVMANFGNF